MRQYQVDIAKQAVLRNTLVSLPTGTGKTLIAAVVMYNFHRWFERGKIVFLAPTRPLVSQQIRACAQVTWISAEHMAELTGTVSGSERQLLWESRRIFFCTPQVFENDLDAGRCPARDVVCLVLDEAHKAQGDYAYVNVVRKIAAQTDRFRVLALTATPGSDRTKIQRVISNLRIAHVEVLHEDDPCLQRYMHAREMETVLVRPNTLIETLQTQAQALAANLMQPLRSYLPRGVPVEKLSGDAALLDDAREKWRRKRGTLTPDAVNALETAHRRLCSCLKAIDLLVYEGFESFFNELRSFAQKEQSVDDGKFLHSPRFNQLWSSVTAHNARSEPILHPKQEVLCGILLDHFANHGADTKAIVFAQYRRVVAGIESTLNRHKPLINARCFVGQAASKGSAGMNQLEQRQLVERFKSGDGDCNVLVATSIGEEGLDIGEVDLIVQYDCLSSHIRTVQRIGRTGRKRNGRAIQLVTAGVEQEALEKKKKAANMIKKVLGRNSKWTFHSGGDFRMFPSPLPNPILSTVDLTPPDGGCADAVITSRDSPGRATQAHQYTPGHNLSQDAACTSSANLAGSELVNREFGGSNQCTEAEVMSPLWSSASTRLSPEDRAMFLQHFSCGTPPVDMSLDSVVSQFPATCAVLTKTFRCAHTALTALLVSTAQDARMHAGTDQIQLGTAHASTSSCCSVPEVSETTAARLPTMDTERRRPTSFRARTADEAISDLNPDGIAELLRNPESVACRAVFCPREIRYLLPDCVDLFTSATSADAGHHHNAERLHFSTPSYISSLNDQAVYPPPAVPQDLATFICGTQKNNRCSPNYLRPGNHTSTSGAVCSPDMGFHSEGGCSNSQPTVRATGATAALASRTSIVLERIGKLADREPAPTADLVAHGGPAPAIPNEVRGSTVPQTSTSAGAAPTVNRGLTEEQRRRIAENRRKAQARRSVLQAQKMSQQHSNVTRSSDCNVHSAQSHTHLRRSTQETVHEAETSQGPSQHRRTSQKGTPADQDSEIELGFSSPSPVATKRLRKHGQEHPVRTKSKHQDKPVSKPTSRGGASAAIDMDRPEDEDLSSQDTLLQKRRRIGSAPQRQATSNRFADDEAVVSGDDVSSDDTDGSDTDGRNSLEGFLDDSQSQALDIARQSQETGSDTDSDRGGTNMLDVYRRSLFSQDADQMGFASPPRQHPNRNRFRTDVPAYHNNSQESETETEAEASGCVDRQSVGTRTDANTSCGGQILASTQQDESGGSSDSSLWNRGEFAMPPPSTRGLYLAQRGTRRESTVDGYTAEVDNDDMLVSCESAEADFDCGVDSLWD